MKNEDIAVQVVERTRKHGDFYEALFAASLDKTRDPEKALELADKVIEQAKGQRKSRFAKAGSAEDCGHTPSGSFAPGNKCAEGSEKSLSPEDVLQLWSGEKTKIKVNPVGFGPIKEGIKILSSILKLPPNSPVVQVYPNELDSPAGRTVNYGVSGKLAPRFISVSNKYGKKDMIATLIHEFGHYLDNGVIPMNKKDAIKVKGVIGARNFLKEPMFDEWRKAIEKSEAVHRMFLDMRRASMYAPIDPEAERYVQFMEYALSPVEIWARSFAQYIAVKHEEMTGDDSILRTINEKQQNLYNDQWSNEDFKDLYKSIDKIMSKLGYLKEEPAHA